MSKPNNFTSAAIKDEIAKLNSQKIEPGNNSILRDLTLISLYKLGAYVYELEGNNTSKSNYENKAQELSDKIANAVKELDKKDSQGEERPKPLDLDDFDINTVIGMEQQKQQINNVFVKPYLYSKLFMKPKGGIMMYGPPGTGKTELAKFASKYIQQESNGVISISMYNADSASMKSKWEGGTEKAIKTYFTVAEENAQTKIGECIANNDKDGICNHLSVLFMDEFDAIASDRSQTDDQSMTRSVNALISNMQGVQSYPNVVVIAATNKPWKIDPAVERRFSSRIFVDIPDDNTRTDMIANFLIHNYDLEEPNPNSTNYKPRNFTTDGGSFLALVEYIMMKTGFHSSVQEQNAGTNDSILLSLAGGKIPANIVPGRKFHNDAVSIYGYSSSDLYQMLTKAFNIAATRSLQEDFTKNDDGFYYPSKDGNLSVGDIKDKSKIKNNTLHKRDIDQALREYPSTIKSDYVEYIWYSITNEQLSKSWASYVSRQASLGNSNQM